ncbi:MAG: carbon-nitrogen hydrolase family protein [Solirubrobacterales bacterium]|nr:carbon-nitrogen hydrolase family protein [Solirubrobacterales bacterium]
MRALREAGRLVEDGVAAACGAITLRVAAAQVEPVPLDVAANVRVAADLVGRAGADLVVFPELSLTGYDLAALGTRPDLHVAPGDPRLEPLAQACREAGTAAVVGAAVPDGDRLLLAAIVLFPDGPAPVVAAKTHLHGDEAGLFAAGEGPVVVDVAGVPVALATCLDANHPEHAAAARAGGAAVYAAGVIFERGTEERLAAHLGGRAAETGMWVVGAQPAGRTGTIEAGGTSGVWAPDGTAVARLGDERPALARATAVIAA